MKDYKVSIPIIIISMILILIGGVIVINDNFNNKKLIKSNINNIVNDSDNNTNIDSNNSNTVNNSSSTNSNSNTNTNNNTNNNNSVNNNSKTNNSNINNNSSVKNNQINYLTINKKDGKIYNKTGAEVVLKGLVLPNVDTVQFDSSIDSITLKSLKNNLGINMIRITLSPNSNIDFDTAFNKIKKAIDNATNNDLYIIIDWGVMKATEGDPRKTLKKNNYNGITTADNFFNSIATYSKNNPYVLYEICNEPYVKEGKSKYENLNTWNAVKEYSNTIIPIIRKNSSNIIIVAGKSGVILNEIAKDPITNYSNIAYTFHMYPYNYKFDTYKPQLEKVMEKKLTLIMTETSIMDASLKKQNKGIYDIDKMDEYLNFFKSKNYSLNFAYFKYDFPFENNVYSEWSILKPINNNYYDTRCNWKANKHTETCNNTTNYVRHMSNINMNTDLFKQYFCNSNANNCSNTKGKGVFSVSGAYFVERFMNKTINN